MLKGILKEDFGEVNMGEIIEFGEFSFNEALGELIHQDGEGNKHISRLAPQPSKLLSLLINRSPDVLGHEDIKVALWPEVHVDYEKSIHFCIRQIRAALHDNASAPHFIETIPRRGYRWIVSHDRIGQGEAPYKFEKGERSGHNPDERLSNISWLRSSSGKVVGIGILLLIGFVFYTLSAWNSKKKLLGSSNLPKARIAIMPFQPEGQTNAFQANDIALHLVESLTNENVYEVIGPTTTAPYQNGKFRQLVQDFQIDCLINGKFSHVNDTSRLLAEVIRAGDGAHIWVKYFDTSTPNETIADMILAGFLEKFGEDFKVSPDSPQ